MLSLMLALGFVIEALKNCSGLKPFQPQAVPGKNTAFASTALIPQFRGKKGFAVVKDLESSLRLHSNLSHILTVQW